MRIHFVSLLLVMSIALGGCDSQRTPQPPATATAVPIDTATVMGTIVVIPTRTPTPAATLTALQEQQLEVIKALFPAYDGPQDVCKWELIRCNEEKRIIEVQAGAEGLTSLSPEIGQLSSLEYLWVYHNKLTTLPPEIGRLASLRFLSLSGNPLMSLPPEISNLSGLRDLQLSGDQLGLLEQISQIPNLKTLAVLSSSEPTVLPPEIGMLTGLELLKANNQRLRELPPEIGHLTNLRTLDISANLLTDLPPEMGTLTNLRYLDVSGNPLTSLSPEICTRLKSAIHPPELCP